MGCRFNNGLGQSARVIVQMKNGPALGFPCPDFELPRLNSFKIALTDALRRSLPHPATWNFHPAFPARDVVRLNGANKYMRFSTILPLDR
jgi:hypothetical protein